MMEVELPGIKHAKLYLIEVDVSHSPAVEAVLQPRQLP